MLQVSIAWFQWAWLNIVMNDYRSDIDGIVYAAGIDRPDYTGLEVVLRYLALCAAEKARL